MKLNSLVKEIIRKNRITKQTEITDILLRDYNISITQSNISRVLKQINAVKVVNNDKEVVYEIQEKLQGAPGLINKLIRSIEDNGYLIVINSYPGSGSIIGQAIDERKFKNVIATVAGDNTLLIIPRNVKEISELREEIQKFIV